MKLTERRRLRLRLRDLAAGSAFAAVALSGALPLFVTVLFAGSFVVSLLGGTTGMSDRVRLGGGGDHPPHERRHGLRDAVGERLAVEGQKLHGVHSNGSIRPTSRP